MKILRLLLCLVSLVGLCLCKNKRNRDVCKDETESYGPIPPTVPEVFTLWASVTDRIENKTSWMKETYDGINKRAKIEITKSGITINYIFDFLKGQMIMYDFIHPNVIDPSADMLSEISCFSDKIEKVNMDDLPFGYRYGSLSSGGRVRMFNQYQVLQFGGNYKFAFVKSEQEIRERGLPVNKYTGCVYNKYDDSTYRVNFYWAQDNFFSDSATLGGVALRKELDGGYYNHSGSDKSKKAGIWNKKSEVQDIIYFIGEPTLQDEDFQVPPRTFCKFGESNKEMPVFPLAFTYRVEKVKSEENVDGKPERTQVHNMMVWYSYDAQIARIDYKPVEKPESKYELDLPNGLFPDATPLSAIFDFNSGISYYIHKATGRCIVRDITPNSYFVSKTKKSKVSDEVLMVTPEELFDIQKPTNFKYKGEYDCRGLKCDVWTSTHTSPKTNATVNRDLYFTTEGYHVEDGDKTTYHALVRDTELSIGIEEGVYKQTLVESNIFRFKDESPDLVDFDVEGCLIGLSQNHFRVTLTFDEKDRDFINKHHNMFLQNIRVAIYKLSGIGTPLRVQRVVAEFKKDAPEVEVVFIMLEREKGIGDDQPNIGKTIKEARIALKNAVDSQQLTLFLNAKEHREEVIIMSKPGSLINFLPFDSNPKRAKRDADENDDGGNDIGKDVNKDGGEGDAEDDVNKDGGEGDTEDDVNKDGGDDDTDVNKDGGDDSNESTEDNSDLSMDKKPEKNKSGMTKGGLIGLAFGIIFIGALLGVAAMWFLLKRSVPGISNRKPDENAIVMSDSLS